MRGETHSIIITFQDEAVVWYPDSPYIDWHFITEDGQIEASRFQSLHHPMSATEFIETYAEGTD